MAPTTDADGWGIDIEINVTGPGGIGASDITRFLEQLFDAAGAKNVRITGDTESNKIKHTPKDIKRVLEILQRRDTTVGIETNEQPWGG